MVLQGGGMARVKMSPHFAICCSERAENRQELDWRKTDP